MERRVGYVTARCALGWLLVAGTERGVCAVMIGDAPGPLVEALRRELPWAPLQEGGPGLEGWTRSLVDLAAGRLPAEDVPLDVRGSRFQRRVWAAIQAIPRGETRSYGELAVGLGQPAGARAVARACATNPTSLVVPCHRVVGGDGTLRGYRWGLDRKRALLAAEQKESDLSLSFESLPSGDGRRSGRSAA